MSYQNALVITIGELLIDFYCTDINVSLSEGDHYMKQAGGAPANVAATITKLGGRASFVGKVGNDPFGLFLENTLREQNVDTSMLLKADHAPTTLAFISRKANGERDFVFHRGADSLLTFEELNIDKIGEAKMIHFGSATALLEDPFRETYLRVMQAAKEKNIFVSFDPNYRHDLWKDRQDEFISLCKETMAYADFIKVSDEELELISGLSDQTQAVQLLHRLGAKVIAVTLGEKGTFLSNGRYTVTIDSIPVISIDTTGAGDAFVGAVLFQWARLDHPKEVIADIEKLKEIVRFANKVGAFVCTKVGAIAALPTYNEVEYGHS